MRKRKWTMVLALLFGLGSWSCRSEPPPELGADVEERPSLEAPPDAVQVVLTSYAIEMPAHLPPGPTTFWIENRADDEEHSFVLESEEMEVALGERLPPGESRALEVDLTPGRYFIYCPVDNHQGFGMEHELTVGDVEDIDPTDLG